MNRKSKRELRNAIDSVEEGAEADTDNPPDHSDSFRTVWQDSDSGELYDGFGPDAERIDPDTLPEGRIGVLPTIDFTGIDT